MAEPSLPVVDAVFVGGPRTLHDAEGSWRSSIRRTHAAGPVSVAETGIAGDKATQRFHGGPESALCLHLADHYQFWRDAGIVDLPAGALGENLTVSGLLEESIFVGDIVRLGSVLAQISGPRVPCRTQARQVGRADWVQLTIDSNRTGSYMRVLEPGQLTAGDTWQLVDRTEHDASLRSINVCMYHQFDPAYAEHMLAMPSLSAWWKKQAAQKLKAHRKGAPA